jgi:metal-responsive CopG/Arc/MetJ family transcriptional regulator
METAERKDLRVQLVLGQSEMDAIDEWRAANRIWSRSAAIRELVKRGLAEGKNHDDTA